MTLYYHGGIPGLKPGEMILPPSETGNATHLAYAREIAPDGPQREDRVYITTSLDLAAMYAGVFPYGTIYEVTPGPGLEHDPDCMDPGLSYQCENAVITHVLATGIAPDKFIRALVGEL